MAKTLVLYKSKYGSTKQYAEWIAQDIGAKALSVSDARPEMLDNIDTLVFGGHLHASSIAGSEFVRNNWARLEGKNVVIFTVSGSKPDDPNLQAAVAGNFPASIRVKAVFFYLRGRAGKLDLLDSILMLFPKMKAYFEYNRTKDKAVLEAYEKMHTFDFVSRESIAPIVKRLRELTPR
jgi:hypothetical protein